MLISDLNHFNLCVPTGAWDQVVQFYTAVLGFERRSTGPANWLYANGRPLLHLTAVDLPGAVGGVVDHIAFSTTGLAGTISRLDATGTQYQAREFPQLGFVQLLLRDPVGLDIELNFTGEVLTPAAAQQVNRLTA